MSQIIQRLDQQQLKSLCGVVAHTSEGLTKSELTTLLGQCGICAVDDGSSRNQLGYTIGLNKRDWLYNCLVTEINRSQSFSKVIIALKISEFDHSQLKNYARTMIGIDLSLQIEKWIAENHLTQQNYTNEQLVKILISFFLETHTLKKEIGCFADICQMWLDGCSFVEMHECTSLPIADLEDICSKSISYELSFFVGNIIDIIEINDEDIVNPLPNLLLLQRRLKYGVKTETAVSVCEKIFNDRFLANLLADKIGHDAIEANSIVGVMKSHKEDILDILSAYPTYFSERVQWICKD